ncbi:putative Heat shock protein 70 family [Medicago truncatula]|uniref:Putative Heat shock protein 70 family n=2 Tax=Medicago truncatula TaxID=3880 RepID=A0A396IEL6_MEDTR|nr:putative Heat shock protein 70 family [Medicago truncatula]
MEPVERLTHIITIMEDVIKNERLETYFLGMWVRSLESELRNADPRSRRFERIRKSLASSQEVMLFCWRQIDHFINMRNYVIVQAVLRNHPLPVLDHAPIRMTELAYAVTIAPESETSREEFVKKKRITGEEMFLPPPEIAIGIDIGTGPRCVAVWNDSKVELFSNTENENIMKSAEIIKDDGSSIGVISASEVTLSQNQEHDMLYEATIYNMRRLIGRIDVDPIVQENKKFPFLLHTLYIGGCPFIAAPKNIALKFTAAEQVLVVYLGQLRVLAETQLERPVSKVVLMVPVSFSRIQLARTQYVCAKAGLYDLKLMPQPTAVALLYAQQQMLASFSCEDMDSESNKVALIFNMDFGYCDVAVTVATAEGECRMKALAGSSIGGEDLLVNMIRYLLPDSENIFKKHIDGDEENKSMSLLRVAILEAIQRLSSQTSVEFDLDLGDGLKICKVVKREEFEDVNKEVFEKCERLIIQSLQDADIKVDDINDVIIVGGCWNIPKVKDLVTKICKGKELYKGMNPLEAALCGAAVAGAVAAGIVDPKLGLMTSHVTPFSVGIQANGIHFVPVIPRNTSMPTTRVMDFTTIHDNQTEALILVYEGEGQKAEENHLLGYLKIMGIPAAPRGVPEINVRMNIDCENGLRVGAAVYMPGSDQPAIPAMEARMPMSMTDDGYAEALNRTYGDTKDLVTLVKME